eukprot:TRINITY_DN16218_c0_g1_i1.p1 TRINITY_DN16218_c0_g1~~TRINITY_DN16218_c0_g1_i1.p1  ORF type:complete len:141 (+),score=38.62 TRINITY_DN16218_c0_g1_i1:132-554(+)
MCIRDRSRIMGCLEPQIQDKECPAGGQRALDIWKNRIMRYSFYSEDCRNQQVRAADGEVVLDAGEWFDFQAWFHYHEYMIRGDKPFYESPITQDKLRKQLEAEIGRMREALANEQICVGNGQKVWGQPSRNDCCMCGDGI